ncbi:MAG: hypothetical protein EZS28_044124, partial [Streblomastix strix]
QTVIRLLEHTIPQQAENDYKENLFAGESGNCAGAALSTAVVLMCSITNSLIYAFIVGRPQFGTGILNENNNEEKLIGTDKENKLLEVTDLLYKKLALSCLQSSVCVDLFLFPDASTPIPIQQDTSSITKSTSSQQLDKQTQLQQSQQQGQKLQSSMEIAALAILPKLTGGEMFSYPHYMERDIIQDADTLRHDIQFAMC